MAKRPYFPMWLIDWSVDEVIEAGTPSPSHTAINDLMAAAPEAYKSLDKPVLLRKIWYKLQPSTQEELWKQHEHLASSYKALKDKEM